MSRIEGLSRRKILSHGFQEATSRDWPQLQG